MERVTDLTGVTFETGESRNLTVSCDLPGGNLSHDAIDACVSAALTAQYLVTPLLEVVIPGPRCS